MSSLNQRVLTRPIALSSRLKKRKSVSESKTSGAMFTSDSSLLSEIPRTCRFDASMPRNSPDCSLVMPMRFILSVRSAKPENMSSGSSAMLLRPKVRYCMSRYLKSCWRSLVNPF